MEKIMLQQQKETLSALFDGEADELEIRRLLSTLDTDSSAQWRRFQIVRDVVKSRLHDCQLDISVADKVSAQIALEPAIQSFNNEISKKQPKNEGWLKPLIGFATAASIAFVTVLGVQEMNHSSTVGNVPGFVANGNVSASQLSMSSNPGFNMVSGSVQTSSLQSEIQSIEAQKKRDQERLRYYMQLHSEQSSFNHGRGLLPVARMSEEEK